VGTNFNGGLADFVCCHRRREATAFKHDYRQARGFLNELQAQSQPGKAAANDGHIK
jgi:hypothetical protein